MGDELVLVSGLFHLFYFFVIHLQRLIFVLLTSKTQTTEGFSGYATPEVCIWAAQNLAWSSLYPRYALSCVGG